MLKSSIPEETQGGGATQHLSHAGLPDPDSCLLADYSQEEFLDRFFPLIHDDARLSAKVDRDRKTFLRSTIHGKAITDPNGAFARAERHGALRIVAEGMGTRWDRGRLQRLLDGVGRLLDACPSSLKHLAELNQPGSVYRSVPGHESGSHIEVSRAALREVVLDAARLLIAGNDEEECVAGLERFWEEATRRSLEAERGKRRRRLLFTLGISGALLGALGVWEGVTGGLSQLVRQQGQRISTHWADREAFSDAWIDAEPLAKALHKHTRRDQHVISL